MAVGTKFEIIDISEFNKVAEKEEVFFWHFVNRNITANNCASTLAIKPLSPIDGVKCNSTLDVLVEELNIKVYESIIEDSLPFLYRFRYQFNELYNPKCDCYAPKFIGFKNGKKVAGISQEVFCYCLEGITEVIYLTDPRIFEGN